MIKFIINTHKTKLYVSLLWFATMCISLTACKHPTKPAKSLQKSSTDYSRLFRRIQGTWMSYEYMLNLNKTSSPFHSAAYMEGIFSFTVDSLHLVDDTLHCLAWINGHEQRDLWIAFDYPDSLGQYSIGVNKDREQHVLYNDNITRIKIDSPYLTIYTSTFDSVRYVLFDRVARKSQAEYPLRHYTAAALFRGDYFIRDSDIVFGSSHIYFDPQHVGRIEGSHLYDSFDINADVMLQNGSKDYIELFDSRRLTESRSFTYQIKKNVLTLYPTITDIRPLVLVKTEPDDTLPRP